MVDDAKDGSRPDRVGGGDGTRFTACDNCKSRKTKCDKGTPCSSCVTANLTCQVTRSRPEKRQRIVISAKYDEALERVNHRLQEVLTAVHALQRDGTLTSVPLSQPSLQNASDFPTGSSKNDVLVGSSTAGSEGYRGESSFEVQIERMMGSLNTLADRLGTQAIPPITRTLHGTQQALEHQQSSQPGFYLPSGIECPPPFLEVHPELRGSVLPPSEPVLRLLRLSQTVNQRLFEDFGFLDVNGFTEMCRDVFFATVPHSMATWSIVNVGLYYLFTDLKEEFYPQVGLNEQQVDEIADILGKNCQLTVESFRICAEASLETCQALALLGTFCMKSGHITKAWNCFSTASRMCMDIGYHKLPPGPRDQAWFGRRHVFWYIYIYDKHLALTLGRTQALHDYDVSTDRMYYANDVHGIPGKIAVAFGEVAVLAGNIQSQLFSASAYHLPHHARVLKVKQFRARLHEIQQGLEATQNDSVPDSEFMEAATVLQCLFYSTSPVLCSALMINTSNPEAVDQLHLCDECKTAARQALTILVEVGRTRKEESPGGWIRYLNLFLSLSPLTSYLVLVRNIFLERSSQDLTLLASVKSVMEPAIHHSPLVQCLYKKCSTLYQLTETMAKQHAEAGLLIDPDPGFLCPPELDLLGGEHSGSMRSLSTWDYFSSGLDMDTIWKLA